MTQGRKIRIYQLICIAYALFCFFIVFDLSVPSNPGPMSPIQWIAIFGALFCAVDGFYMQKRILRGPRNPSTVSKSTPGGRWILGNVVRLAFATGVCCWALVLHFSGGPEWLAGSLIGLGLVLLAALRPGSCPATEP